MFSGDITFISQQDGICSKGSVFTTERLQLAIYLHASKRLTLSHCECKANGKVRFVFQDPNHLAAHAELEFAQGALLPAIDLFASQTFLRRKMSEAIENRRIQTNESCSSRKE
jgi:hypothetical protein